MRLSSDGLARLRKEEGLRLHPYDDSAGHATIGCGHLIHKGRVTAADMARFAGFTEADAVKLLAEDVAPREQAVARDVKVALSQNEFDALVSFVFNVGAGHFASSTALRRLNSGDRHACADELLRWVKGGRGLPARRSRERDLFLSHADAPASPAPANPAGSELRAGSPPRPETPALPPPRPPTPSRDRAGHPPGGVRLETPAHATPTSAAPDRAPTDAAKTAAGPDASRLSGRAWFDANESRYPTSKDLAALDPTFREAAKRFVDALRTAGAHVSIGDTRRDARRSWVMHWAWEIANGRTQPKAAPLSPDVDIAWDHGDDATSRKSARDMVEAFKMDYEAALESNHIHGTAIDMTISWKAGLTLEDPRSGERFTIGPGPANGQNHDLWKVADRAFGVKKLPKDKPHWSINGR
jgi:GH24 family phage-related lysozyme (muramidase)